MKSPLLPSEIGETPTGIIILAAGASTRMGQSKQLLSVHGKTLLEITVQAALQAGCEKVGVVLGADISRHQKALTNSNVTVIPHSDWQKGMGSSIKAGLRFLLKDTPSLRAVIILVCDQPLLTSDHLQKLLAVSTQTGSPVVASFYAGMPGVPALFKKEVFENLLNLEDAHGAKKIILQYGKAVETVDFPGGAVDLDTPDDYSTFIRQNQNP